jgi:hypothetical protein
MALNNAVNATQSGYQVLNATTGAWSGRTFQAGTGISLTNADGTAGNTTITASGGSPPNTNAIAYEEFMGFSESGTSTTFNGSLPWLIEAVNRWAFVYGDNEAGHPGCVTNATLGAGGIATLSPAAWQQGGSNAAFYPVVLTGGGIVLNWIFKISTLSNSTNRYTLTIGYINQALTHNIQFSYSDNLNSGNWVISTTSGATTTTNSGTAVTAAWHNAQITVNSGATSVNFTMDGVSLGDIATNIPTGEELAYFFKITRNAGAVAQQTIKVDAMYFNQTLTR